MEIRVGLGFDSHEFEEGRDLFLGGLKVEGYPGFRAHSDGDVILHALTDAILGAIGEGDIGTLFPDSDPQWKGASSELFVKKAVEMMRERGYQLINADIVYVAEFPKIREVREKIRDRLEEITGFERERFTLKGKRPEGIEVRGGALCIASVLIGRKD